jgi:hypothetical protein
MTPDDEQPTQSTAGFPRTARVMTRLAYDHALKAGLPARALARRAGLSLAAIQDSNVRLDVRDQGAFLDSVAAAADDDSL